MKAANLSDEGQVTPSSEATTHDYPTLVGVVSLFDENIARRKGSTTWINSSNIPAAAKPEDYDLEVRTGLLVRVIEGAPRGEYRMSKLPAGGREVFERAFGIKSGELYKITGLAVEHGTTTRGKVWHKLHLPGSSTREVVFEQLATLKITAVNLAGKRKTRRYNAAKPAIKDMTLEILEKLKKEAANQTASEVQE